jgi:hypothetical protein
MTKAHDELAHKFPHFTTPELRADIERIEQRVKLIQRSSSRANNRALLSDLQSTLHRMKLELKRRDEAAKRAHVDQVMRGELPAHAITPSQTA